MNLPEPTDYIDIHTHGSISATGIFRVENLMAHETRLPDPAPRQAFTFGIHPWFLNEGNHKDLITRVKEIAPDPEVVAVGEAGFDKIRGAPPELQREVFEIQVRIAEELHKPLIIHCVRAWDELLQVHRKFKPEMPWMVHGFRGKKELAMQLISRGMYLSFWFSFILRQESSELIRFLPSDRIFPETDGSDADIAMIYTKVSADLGLTVNELKQLFFNNFNRFFGLIS